MEAIKEFFNYIRSIEFSQAAILIFGIFTIFMIFKNLNLITELGNKILSKFKRKRNCIDCSWRIINLVSDTIKRKRERNDKILDDEMNYVEMILETVSVDLLSKYKEYQIQFRKEKVDVDLENKEYIMYKESLQNVLFLVKKEIRRSFKENGFHEKDGNEFSEYIKNKSKELIAIAKRYLMAAYPDSMQVPLKYKFDNLSDSVVEGYIYDIFENAKDIVKKANDDIAKIELEYKDEINNIIN